MKTIRPYLELIELDTFLIANTFGGKVPLYGAIQAKFYLTIKKSYDNELNESINDREHPILRGILQFYKID